MKKKKATNNVLWRSCSAKAGHAAYMRRLGEIKKRSKVLTQVATNEKVISYSFTLDKEFNLQPINIM